MLAQFDHSVMSSFLLWFDNKLLTKGQAYNNYASRFFRIDDIYSNVFAYGLPFKQVVADSSLTGATIMSGIYLNNTFIGTGVSGLVNINFNEGQVYFTGNMDSQFLSGRYAVKDFNVYLTNEPEEKLLFETRFETRPTTSRQITGLASNEITYPSIFIRNNSSDNIPFALGGQDRTVFEIRALIIADSQFNIDGVCSIFRDTVRTSIGIIPANEMPFTHLGGFRSGHYSYPELISNKLFTTDCLWVNRVSISRFNRQDVILNELRQLNPKVFVAIIDFEIESVRYPRV